MASQRKNSRTVGTVIVVVLLAVIAIALYNGTDIPGLSATSSNTTSTSQPSEQATEPSPTSNNDPAESATNEIPSGTFAATVNYVHDGDTLYLYDGSQELKVRLIGIDTPELDSEQRPEAGECYGEQARELLRDFLPEGTRVLALEDREPQDHYGRSLLYVYLPDGTFVNLAMIELGAAEALKVGLNDRFWPQLRAAEDDAFAAKVGMWGAC